DGNNLPKITLTRGPDLSGSLQGAGGIGGLLALSQLSTPSHEHFYYHCDGNGNATCLINTNQLVVGRYLYDPFGSTLSISGPKALANRYRFSSKPIHEQSGLYGFLYRWYGPELQRWLNQDPIGELGFETTRNLLLNEYAEGSNPHSFVLNDPVNKVDYFG